MITEKKFEGVDSTLHYMYYLIKKYCNDPHIDQLTDFTLKQLFDFVSQKIKYLIDPINVQWLDNDNVELLKSPVKTLEYGVGDCDCKAILSGAVFEKIGLPYRIVITSDKPNKKFHHVYPEIFWKGNWKPFDATYSHNKFLEEKPFTAKRVYYQNKNQLLKQDVK